MTVKLNWSSFSTNFARFSRDLLCDDKLADVILVSEDLTQFQAHKLILCACSDLFRTLLTNIPHPNPMLYLKGINQEELQSVLEFIYLGETTVAEEDIQRVLTAARELEVSHLNQEMISEGGEWEQRAKRREDRTH